MSNVLSLNSIDRKVIEKLANRYVVTFSKYLSNCDKLQKFGIIERYDKPIRGRYTLITEYMRTVTLTSRGKVLALLLGMTIKPYYEANIGKFVVYPSEADHEPYIKLEIYYSSYIHIMFFDPISMRFGKYERQNGKWVILPREDKPTDSLTLTQAYRVVNNWKKALAKHEDQIKNLSSVPLGIVVQLGKTCSKHL